MAGPTWSLLLFLGLPLALSMPQNDVEGGVPLSVEMPHSRQDIPTEDFSGGFSRDFAQDLPTQEFMGDFQSVPAASENSVGFIIGIPENFPAFSSVGGFEPMPALPKEGGKGSSFASEFSIPLVSIPDIQDNQPQFDPSQFTKQVSETRGDRRQLHHQPPSAPPPSHHHQVQEFQQKISSHHEDEDGFRLIFPDPASIPDEFVHSVPDHHPQPDPPPPNLIPHPDNEFQHHQPTHIPHAPVRGRPHKRPNKSPFDNFLKPFRNIMRLPIQRNTNPISQFFQ